MYRLNKEDFLSPGKEYAVIYSWTWNAPISREESEKQIDEFCEAGISGIYIIPLPKEFRPTTSKTFLEPGYLTDEFMVLVNHAVSYAVKKGLAVWVYDEGGWPSGGACSITAKHNKRAIPTVLKVKKKTVASGETIIYSHNTMGIFKDKKMLSDGFVVKDKSEITEYYSEEFTENPNLANIADASVTDTFLDVTYEKYKACLGEMFGKDVDVIFTDEPMLLEYMWQPDFEKLFLETYGYDLLPFLPCIFDEKLAQTEKEYRARIDYGILLGKIFKKNYFEKVHLWCQNNNVKFTGHINIDHTCDGGVRCRYGSVLNVLRDFDIPGIDVIWRQIKMPRNGEKPVEEGSSFFPRLASSAARQRGNRFSLTESFGVYGESLSPDEIRYVVNYQAARGINIFNFMLCSYGKTGGLAFVESPSFTSEKPGFYSLKHINDYVSRLSYLMSLGEIEGSTALYIPNNDIMAGGIVSKKAMIAYDKLGAKLEEDNVNFDIIDDEGIRAAIELSDGLKLGDAIYKSVVVPTCMYMPEDIKQKIKNYTAEPCGNSVQSNDKNIIIRCRNLQNGKIVFAFNQGCDMVNTQLLTTISYKNIYQLSLTDGNYYKTDNMSVSLLCGQEAVFYLTDEELDAFENNVDFQMMLDNPQIVSVDRFVIESDGMKNIKCDFDEIKDADFSGEVTLQYEYSLPEIPTSKDVFKLTMTNGACWGRVYIDDNEALTLGMSPMNIVFSGDMISKTGTITFKISNTPGNEVFRKKSYFDSLPPEEVGPYRKLQFEFEKSSVKLQIGKLILQKIR